MNDWHGIRIGVSWLVEVLLICLFLFAYAIHGHAANAITTENAKTGTTNWQLSNPATSREIEGYCDKDSVAQGSSTTCYVSTASTQYTTNVYRIGWYQAGNGGRLVAGPTTRSGVGVQTVPTIDANGTFDCATVPWTGGFTISVPSDPSDWTTGQYLIVLTNVTGGKQAYIPFVVRDDTSTASFYMQMPTTTWQAYNDWPRGSGGKDFYTPSGTEAVKVSFNRPYGMGRNTSAVGPGVGAGNLIADQATSPVSAIGYEILLIRWMERVGYDIAYCTDVDNHTNGALMLNHRIQVSNGHDEYWSRPMRVAWTAARTAGKHLAFIGSNDCYWLTRFEFSGATRTITCYKLHAPSSDPFVGVDNANVTAVWSNATYANLPESELVGIRYGNNPNEQDLVITNPTHWAFAGTGITNNQHFPGLVTGEADFNQGDPVTPAGLTILATSPYGGNTSHMSIYTQGSSIVWATGTFGWAYGLDDLKLTAGSYTWPFTSTQIPTITQNIFGRMLGGTVRCRFDLSTRCA